MKKQTTPNPEVNESTTYENLIDVVDSFEEYRSGYQPPKPIQKDTSYPFKLNVHTWTRGDTDLLAKTLGMKLQSDEKSVTFQGKSQTKPENCNFIEKRKDPLRKRTSHKDRIESQLWTDTVEFRQDGWVTYMSFKFIFPTEKSLMTFCRLVKQRVSLDTKAINFPQRKPKVWKYHWVCRNPEVQPIYPMYIVSKGRGDSRLTSRCFERIRVPYYIVIEPQDYDEYSCVIDEEKILVLPFSNHGDGPGRARNWCWDHSMKNGFKRHWVFDDNISDFYRIYSNRRIPIGDGGMFRVCEEFADRFENVPVAGLNYDFFVPERGPYPPFIRNTRIYSALLIENSCPYRWRGRYNEDTILSLDVLSNGLCTIQFNCLLQGKSPTQNLGGGNTAEFYEKEGTYNKSKMLEIVYPNYAKTVWRYGRYHHEVDYSSFRDNEFRYVSGYDPEENRGETDRFVFDRIKDYFQKRGPR